MLQIKFLNYKIKRDKLELHLMYTHNLKVTIWNVPLKKPLRGYNLPCKHELRRSMYDLAYSYSDRCERHVLITATWYIYNYPKNMTTWVKDGFLEQIDEKYEGMLK